MAFTFDPTTELGRLRELLGDTYFEDHLFTDAYLMELLAQNRTIVRAAVMALHRILNDSQLFILRYRRFGRLTPAHTAQLKRNIIDQIRSLETTENRTVYRNITRSETPSLNDHLTRQERQ